MAEEITNNKEENVQDITSEDYIKALNVEMGKMRLENEEQQLTICTLRRHIIKVEGVLADIITLAKTIVDGQAAHKADMHKLVKTITSNAKDLEVNKD